VELHRRKRLPPTLSAVSFPDEDSAEWGRVCLDSGLFAVHLARVERFSPDARRLFDDTNRPGDGLVRRMLAANVEPLVVRTAFARLGDLMSESTLCDVAVPPMPTASWIPPPSSSSRSGTKPKKAFEAIEWDVVEGAAIRGCDFKSNYFVAADASKCRARCLGLTKCRAYSYLKRTKTCYLKSCGTTPSSSSSAQGPAPEALRPLEGVDSGIKRHVPVSFRDECVVASVSQTTQTHKSTIEAAFKSLAPGSTKTAILVTVHDALEWVLRCVAAIWTLTPPATYHLFLVNDNSAPQTLEHLRAAVARDAPAGSTTLVNWADASTSLEGYTRAINLGLRVAMDADDAAYDAFCLLNSDTEVLTRDWLAALRRAAFSDETMGVVGPLSNAASYQSVPRLRETTTSTPSKKKKMNASSTKAASRSSSTDWSKNPLPDDSTWTPAAVQRVVARTSRRLVVDVPVLNGFCLYVKRRVVDAVGLMDDVAFPHGFGEENDFALRAARLGFRLGVVDAAYVWHHKSKSYGDATRKALAREARGVMKRRWGPHLDHAVTALEANLHLRETRRRVDDALSAMTTTSPTQHSLRRSSCADPGALRVLFVLNPTRRPARGAVAMHGGWISVVNQAYGLRLRGVCARVAVSAWTRPTFVANFAAKLADHPDLVLAYDDAARTPVDVATALYDAYGSFDVVVATLFTTVEAISYLARCYPRVQTAYFIQDYEAKFDALTTAQERDALESYTLVEGMLLFAKTAWLQRTVADRHNVTVHKVQASLDLQVFDQARLRTVVADPFSLSTTTPPGDGSSLGGGLFRSGAPDVVRVVAMIRPSTPRRNPEATLRVLYEVRRALGGDRVEVHTFGCAHDELDEFLDTQHHHEQHVTLAAAATGVGGGDDDLRVLFSRSVAAHHGTLARDQVAALFAASDIFLDMSHWQAFGRTGLEAMAAGCVPVLPAASGAEEYARHQVNAVLHKHVDAVARLTTLASRPRSALNAMRRQALATAAGYGFAQASQTLLDVLCRHLARRAAADPALLVADQCRTTASSVEAGASSSAPPPRSHSPPDGGGDAIAADTPLHNATRLLGPPLRARLADSRRRRRRQQSSWGAAPKAPRRYAGDPAAGLATRRRRRHPVR